MPDENYSVQPAFWESRYLAGRMPWDCGGVPRALSDFIAARPERGRVLIPGCGSGYEVQALHDAGYDVVAIDFSPAAMAQLGDFFTFECTEKFDLIYERAFLCSLPPNEWPRYAERAAQLLRPGGTLAGFFIYGEEPEPPPFPLTDDEAVALLGGKFERVRSIRVTDSLPLYAGKERWEEWQRR